MWTKFFDMHSGGSAKEQWTSIYIEAPQEEAEIIFYNRFGHNPHRVTCSCCGEDYSVCEEKSLAKLTEFKRRDKSVKKIFKLTGKYPAYNDKTVVLMPLKEYIKCKEVLFIKKEDIKPEEKIGSIPKKGWVWVD